jgi:hypothetical protein
MIRAFLAYCRLLPKELDKLHLQYALAHLSKHNPLHPDLPWIVLRLKELA